MITRPIAAAAIFALAAAAGSANAQTTAPAAPAADIATDAAIAQLRKDMRAEKTDVISGTMAFTADEAAKFWPLYKAYEAKRRAIGDEQVALIKDFANSYEGMKDAKAQELLTRLIAVEDKTIAAKREFVRELQKVLPAKTVARYYQVDNRLDLLLRLELSSQLPVIK
jgi:hypothetical protein